jgi:hypothetical protein
MPAVPPPALVLGPALVPVLVKVMGPAMAMVRELSCSNQSRACN